MIFSKIDLKVFALIVFIIIILTIIFYSLLKMKYLKKKKIKQMLKESTIIIYNDEIDKPPF